MAQKDNDLSVDEAKKLRDAAIGDFEIFGVRYHSPLPEELRPWYCYTPDGGHCVLCVLDQHYKAGMSLDEVGGHLVPLPVKTVLRSYRMEAGVPVVSGVQYSPFFGAVAPEGDDEFDRDESQPGETFVAVVGVGQPIDEKLRAKLAPAGPEQAFMERGTAFVVLPNLSPAEREKLAGTVSFVGRDAGDVGIATLEFDGMSFDIPVGRDAVLGNSLMISVIDSANWSGAANRMVGLDADAFAFLQAKMRRSAGMSDAEFLAAIDRAYNRFDSLRVRVRQEFSRGEQDDDE